MKQEKIYSCSDLFVQGAISEVFLKEASSLQDAGTGAVVIFQGRVRADVVSRTTVSAIRFTAYRQMAEERLNRIIATKNQEHANVNILVRHSLGEVKVSECCFFVLVAAPRRKLAFELCHELVEEIKLGLPIWGEELFADGINQWKVNTDI